MSYLQTPNLVFTGDFLADVSTVNNDVRHYDNSSFDPIFQEPQGASSLNGWWNPEGGSVFNLQNCTVQQICLPDGSCQRIAGGTDPVLGQLVGGPDRRATGKMLDIDPQWQMSSELWCVGIRIYTGDNKLLLSGDIDISGFRDLQSRQTDGGKRNGQPMGGGWTSVLTNVQWGDVDSPFLSVLRKTTESDTLSIQLNMYGYYYAHNDGRFAMGRIIGTIGPWKATEPRTFAPNRRLYGIMDWSEGSTYLQYSNFLVDKAAARVNVDLGASIPIADSLGTITDTTPYYLGVLTAASDASPSGNSWPAVYLQPADLEVIGPVDYTTGNADWLNTTGGFISLPLTAGQLTLLADHQLVLVTPSTNQPGQYILVCRESIGGYNIRADRHNQRLEAGLMAGIDVYAYQWGEPLNNASIGFAIQPPTPAFFGGQTKGPHAPTASIPYINTPSDGLTLPAQLSTDATGKCTLPVTGNRIGTPRDYLDGQMYYISYTPDNIPADAAAYGMDAIYVSLRTYYEVPDAPTWDDVSPVLTQFGNVYPVMSKHIVDLGSEAAVLSKKDILIYAFTRDIHDPFYMPVTRDLSDAMRQTIVKWLHNPLPGKSQPVAAVRAADTQAAQAPLEESQEIKKVQELTMAKNGASRFKALAVNPFTRL